MSVANNKRSLTMSLKPKVRKNTSSTYKGVSFCKNKKSKQWRAYIKIENKLVQLGYHDTEELAAAAYDTKALEHFGSKAVLNLKGSN